MQQLKFLDYYKNKYDEGLKMIIIVFGVLVGIALVMIYLGYAIDIPIYSTVGFFLMFMLSLNLINNNLEYQTGYTEAITKDVRCCSNITNYAYDSNIITYTYANAETRVIGIYLAIASGIGMILVLISSTDFGRKMFNRGAG